jgi:hypothetical protein
MLIRVDLERLATTRSGYRQCNSRTLREMNMSDLKLEAVVIPVSDVDRSKSFYSRLGWRLDADFAVGESFRVVQFTPPGSPASKASTSG